MDNSLFLISIVFGLVCLVLSLITGIYSYRKAKNNYKSKEYTNHLQTPLVNSNTSIKEAVKYLKIVNKATDNVNNPRLKS